MPAEAELHPAQAAPPDQPTEPEAWALLLSVDGLGPAGLGALLAAYGSGLDVLAAARRPGAASRLSRIARAGDRRAAPGQDAGPNLVAAVADLDVRLAVLRAAQLTIVHLDHPAYPPRLRAIELPPPVLLVRGDPTVLSSAHTVAVVGTRRPTEHGRLIAARIADTLAAAGAIVVSGLAVGIDGAAHAAAVHGGVPTIAVLGSGHDRLFPMAHRRLADEIVAGGGAVVSEWWPEQPPTAFTFPRRNRVISGLADATVVVEAPRRSGALITAKWALEQGRGLFLVPGPIDEPRSGGCLEWLRDYPGEARIVAGIPELIADLDLGLESVATARDARRPRERASARRPGLDALLVELGPTARQVGAALVAGQGSLDELVASTGLPAATILGAITLLELRGLATSTYGRYRAAGELASATAVEVRGARSGGLPGRTDPC